MSNSGLLFFNLAKAQMNLGQRMAELAQQSASRWAALGQQALAHELVETQAESAQSATARGWPGTASLPLDVFWRSLLQGVSVTQEVAQTAIINQTEVSAGLRRALADWQQASALALSHSGNAMPLHSVLNDMLRASGMHAAADSAPARAEGARGR